MRLSSPITARRGSHFLSNKDRNPRRFGERGGSQVHVDSIRGDHAEDIVRRNPIRGCSQQVLQRQAGVCQYICNDNVATVVYTKGGQSIVYHIGRSADLPSEVGNLPQSGYQGVSTAYSIKNGKIVTSLAETPFEVAVYKLGDTYYGVRSNEFGYANYQIMAKPPVNLVKLGKGESENQADYLHVKE